MLRGSCQLSTSEHAGSERLPHGGLRELINHLRKKGVAQLFNGRFWHTIMAGVLLMDGIRQAATLVWWARLDCYEQALGYCSTRLLTGNRIIGNPSQHVVLTAYTIQFGDSTLRFGILGYGWNAVWKQVKFHDFKFCILRPSHPLQLDNWWYYPYASTCTYISIRKFARNHPRIFQIQNRRSALESYYYYFYYYFVLTMYLASRPRYRSS